MRNLMPMLFICFLALGAAAAPANALSLALPATPFASEEEADEAEEEPEPGEDGLAFEEPCEEDEEGFCVEEAETEECAVEDATATVAANPDTNTVSLIVRYEASAPATVVIDSRLRGGRGNLHLGASHTRFRRAGTFRDNFVLGEKRMERVLAAREFLVEVRQVDAPRYCRVELNGALRRAKRSLRAGASGRSGGRGQTRGR